MNRLVLITVLRNNVVKKHIIKPKNIIYGSIPNMKDSQWLLHCRNNYNKSVLIPMNDIVEWKVYKNTKNDNNTDNVNIFLL